MRDDRACACVVSVVECVSRNVCLGMRDSIVVVVLFVVCLVVGTRLAGEFPLESPAK